MGLIYASYPDAKLPKQFLDLISMAMEHFSNSELEALANLQTGIATKCTFPPRLAEISEFVRDLRTKKEVRQERLQRFENYQQAPPLEIQSPLRERFAITFNTFANDPHATAALSALNAEQVKAIAASLALKGPNAIRKRLLPDVPPLNGEEMLALERRFKAVVSAAHEKAGWKQRKPFQPYPKLWAAFSTDPDIIDILNNRNPAHPVDFEAITEASKTLATRGKEAAREVILQPRRNKGYVPPPPKFDISDFPDTPAHSWSGDDMDPLQ